MRGDGLFKRKDGNGWYLSWVGVDGRRHRRKAKGCTLAEARKDLENERDKVAGYALYGKMPSGNDGFSDFCESRLDFWKASLSQREFQRRSEIIRGHLTPFFKGRLADITKADIETYMVRRCEKASPGTVRKEMMVLKRLLNLAVEDEKIPASPAAKVKSPKDPPGRVRYLQPEEVGAVLDKCPRWLKPIATLAVSTGMRRGEILRLRWLDVDLVDNRIILPQTKNGDGRIIYMNEMALDALRSVELDAETDPEEPIFRLKVTPEEVSWAFKRACSKAGIHDVTFHDLRHTAASWLRMSGADIHTVAEVLGHKDLRMAKRYQHLSPGFLAEAMKRLDRVSRV